MSGCVSCTDSLDQSLTKVPFDTSTGVFDCAGSRKSGQHLRPSVLCGRHKRCTTLGAFFFVGRLYVFMWVVSWRFLFLQCLRNPLRTLCVSYLVVAGRSF